jgi:hypothetical protein
MPFRLAVPTNPSRWAPAPSRSRGLTRFKDTLQTVYRWVADHTVRVGRVFLVEEEGSFALFVTPAGSAYDRSLTSLLSEFAGAMTDAGMDLRVSQIPNGTEEELAAYFNTDGSFELLFK